MDIALLSLNGNTRNVLTRLRNTCSDNESYRYDCNCIAIENLMFGYISFHSKG